MAGEIDTSFQQAQLAGFEQYARMAAGPARTALLKSMDISY